MAWTDDLQPASWNGVGFYVNVAEIRAGRNTALHPYPFRDDNPIWVEDLGLAPFANRITGFLIGDDIADQQNSMLDAVQTEGQGELVHPQLGSLIGSIVGGCQFTLRKDRGRYIEIGFEFIENDASAPYPTTAADTQSGVSDAGQTAQSAIASDYLTRTGSTTPSALADAPGPGHA